MMRGVGGRTLRTGEVASGRPRAREGAAFLETPGQAPISYTGDGRDGNLVDVWGSWKEHLEVASWHDCSGPMESGASRGTTSRRSWRFPWEGRLPSG